MNGCFLELPSNDILPFGIVLGLRLAVPWPWERIENTPVDNQGKKEYNKKRYNMIPEKTRQATSEIWVTTKTVILGTSTVHATTHMACPTNAPHQEIRDVSEAEEMNALQERDFNGEEKLSIKVAEERWSWYRRSECQSCIHSANSC